MRRFSHPTTHKTDADLNPFLSEIISPGMFRAVFGIRAFIPFMMTMHSLLPGRFYGMMGYLVFSFLFDWHDDRWERDLRARMFQFAPVYVSAESMRWWLGRECFAKHRCILATREENSMEDEEDAEEDVEEEYEKNSPQGGDFGTEGSTAASQPTIQPLNPNKNETQKQKDDKARFSWFGPGTPPFRSLGLWRRRARRWPSASSTFRTQPRAAR